MFEMAEKEQNELKFEEEQVEESKSNGSEEREEIVRQMPSYKETKKRKKPDFKLEERKNKSKQKKYN